MAENNPILLIWREARRKFPKDRDKAIEEYRRMLDARGDRIPRSERGRKVFGAPNVGGETM